MSLSIKSIYSNKNNLIHGLYEIQFDVRTDSRGYFYEAYNLQDFEKNGLNMKFVQDNVSFSHKNVLRGMHFQKKHPQGKLIQCLSGTIFDVVIDIRKESATYGEYGVCIISSDTHNSLYIPAGFAHGYYVLSDSAMISYKCSDFYHPEDEDGILWNDKKINIKWPFDENTKPLIMQKDLIYKDFE